MFGKVFIVGLPAAALWDTGAQVSITWHDFPDIKINPIEDLIKNNLDLKAANGLSTPYNGFIEVSFNY